MTASTSASLSSAVADPGQFAREATSSAHDTAGRRVSEARIANVGQEKKRVPSQGRSVAFLHAVAALIWLPQAALLALSVGMIADAAPMISIVPAASAVLVLGVLKAWLEKAASRRSFQAARRVLSQKRAEALAIVATASPLDSSRTTSGEAASVIAESAEALVPYLSRFLPARMKATVVPIVFFVAIFPFSWVAALVLLFAMPTIPLFMALIGWQAKAASEKQLAETGNMNAFLLDRLRGLQTIRSLEAVDLTARRLRGDAENLKKRTMAVLRIAFLSSAVLELFAALGVAMTAVYVGFHLLGFLEFGAWGQRLTLAEGLFILLLAPAFFEPMRELSAVWHDRAAGEAAMDALRKFRNNAVSVVGTGQHATERSIASAPTLEIKGLSFAYPGGPYVICDFDLSVREGESVALLGPSGCGKSTILSLIAGFAAADTGLIEIGGTPLNADTADPLRQTVGWISQKPFFTASSLKANVRFGRPDITDTSVDRALQETGLDALVSERQHCTVGDGGHGISGGEAVRLAIARAVADPAAKLLLVDEPTAHLDRETAERIADSLCRLAKGRTLVVATHDPVLAGRMDRVVDLAALSQGEKRS